MTALIISISLITGATIAAVFFYAGWVVRGKQVIEVKEETKEPDTVKHYRNARGFLSYNQYKG